MKSPFWRLAIFPVTFFSIFGLWQLMHYDFTRATPPYELVALPPGRPASTTPLPPPSVTGHNATATIPTLVVTSPAPTVPPVVTPTLTARYFEITTGCTALGEPTCARVYADTSTTSPLRVTPRKGILLAIKNTVVVEGVTWHEIYFPEGLRYPERLTLPWFIEDTAGTVLTLPVPEELTATTPTTSKRIVVERQKQTLTTYEGDTRLATYTISTGLPLTPTPRGEFTVYRKTASRYMQGPIPGISTKYYDLPGVPFNLYFTKEGAVIHGAFWHTSFGQPYSNGCVNLRPADARAVYDWAVVGTTVIVQD